jgi:hypothetical protein
VQSCPTAAPTTGAPTAPTSGPTVGAVASSGSGGGGSGGGGAAAGAVVAVVLIVAAIGVSCIPITISWTLSPRCCCVDRDQTSCPASWRQAVMWYRRKYKEQSGGIPMYNGLSSNGTFGGPVVRGARADEDCDTYHDPSECVALLRSNLLFLVALAAIRTPLPPSTFFATCCMLLSNSCRDSRLRYANSEALADHIRQWSTELSRTSVNLSSRLGAGEFGEVFGGQVKVNGVLVRASPFGLVFSFPLRVCGLSHSFPHCCSQS